MTTAQQPKQSTTQRILNALLKLFFQDPTVLLELLFDIFQHIPIVKSLPGMYEVLDYEAQVELKDSKGHKALYSKHQQVRFLQNNIIAYQDKAWGDGEIFADYQCSPGAAVDRYRDGHRYNILISLRETKHRDDELTFHIKRTILNGFTQATEEFQTEIDHRTRKLTLRVIFPKSRLPTKVNLIEQNTTRSLPLDRSYRQVLADGRHEYTWQTQTPRLYEAYIIRWEW